MCAGICGSPEGRWQKAVEWEGGREHEKVGADSEQREREGERER